MRINGKEPRVIFALNTDSELSDVRAIRAAGIDHFAIGRGSYNGKSECVYNVSIDDLPKVRELAAYHNQESVLILDNQYNAWLSFKDGNYPSYSGGASEMCKFLGEFKEVSSTQAARLQSWSQFHGVYYAAR